MARADLDRASPSDHVSDHVFRRITARAVVLWSLLCVALFAGSFLSMLAAPSHPFVVTPATGRYVILSPDAVAHDAGIRRGDLLLVVNKAHLSEQPLSRAPLRTDGPNVYELQRPSGRIYSVRLPHRELGFPQLFASELTYMFLLLLLFPAIYLIVGFGVYRARPELRSSWALLLLSGFMAAYLAGALHPGRRLPGTELLLGFNAAMMLVPGLHLVTMYPVELEGIRRRRGLLLIPYVLAFGFFSLYAVAYTTGRGHLLAMSALLYWNLAVITAIGLYMAVGRRHMPTRDLRDRLDIALLGYTVSAIPVAAAVLLQDLLRATLPLFFAFGWFVCFPLAIAVGILRQKSIGIRDLAKSSFVYGLLTVAITGSYALAVALIGTLYGSFQLGNPWISFPVIFGLVLLFSPLRERLQAVADRLFERDRAYYQQTVRNIGEALVSLLSVDDIVERVLWVVTGPMGASRGAVLLLDDDRTAYRLAMTRGAQSDAGWRIPSDHPLVNLVWTSREGISEAELPSRVLPEALERCRVVYHELGVELLVPLTFGVDLRGLIAVGGRQTGEPLRSDDRELMQTLASQAAVAIENALAYEEIARLNRTLEARIDERTRELRETQVALAQREKMASIGQLVAGVAHEINNPVSFVHSNLQLIGEQIERLLAAVASADVSGASEARGNVERLLARSQEGTRRVREIVQALRSFSRVDQKGMDDADLCRGLETTLQLMAPRLREVEVVRELSAIPPVRCHAGQINQVLMNLIMNACDAGATRIAVRTGADDRWVRVDVEDNGSGIQAEHQTRVFEPFFTTKGVGEGTGLGLAISHGIVERHGGRIGVHRTGPEGTTFRVELPIKGPS